MQRTADGRIGNGLLAVGAPPVGLPGLERAKVFLGSPAISKSLVSLRADFHESWRSPNTPADPSAAADPKSATIRAIGGTSGSG